jgi:hypothetical protein
VRPVEAAVRSGVRRQATVRGDERVEEVEPTEACGGAQVAGDDAVLREQLGSVAVAPKERHEQRRASVATRRNVNRRPGVEQHPREQRQAAVGGLVQRCPPMGVGVRDIGPALQQDSHQPLVASGRGHCEQVVAVRPLRRSELREAVEQRPQAVDVVGLESAVRACERLAALAQRCDVTSQCPPAGEAVLARERSPGTRGRQPRLPAGERRHRGGRAVLRRGEQTGGATLVVLQIVVVSVLQTGTVGLHPLDVGAQPRPARKAVLARERELRIGELHILAPTGVDATERVRIPRPVGTQQSLGLLLQMLQARSSGQ